MARREINIIMFITVLYSFKNVIIFESISKYRNFTVLFKSLSFVSKKNFLSRKKLQLRKQICITPIHTLINNPKINSMLKK